MENIPDVDRTLDQCMLNIKGASEVMADDMNDAAMRLGAATMMLTSAHDAVYNRAAQEAQTDPGIGGEPDARARSQNT
jgi:hypothetical protein